MASTAAVHRKAAAAFILRRPLIAQLLQRKRSVHQAACSSEIGDVSCLAKKTEMKSWRLHSFTGINSVSLDSRVPLPSLTSPDDVLVKVKAASINPLDLVMAKGYGNEAFRTYRSAFHGSAAGLPMTLGRDFSGVVVDTGMDPAGGLKPGDEVWGTVFPAVSQGAHAEYVVASAGKVGLKPQSLTHVEAAAVPFAALTAWGGLAVTAELGCRAAADGAKNVLVVGAAGGVGHLAVQILKAWNMNVVAVCADDAFEMVTRLGADVVLDYNSPEFPQQLERLAGKMNVVFDCSSTTGSSAYEKCLKPWSNSKYVTFNSPMMRSIDQNGLVVGALDTAFQLVHANLNSVQNTGSTHRWGYYLPSPAALKEIAAMAEKGQLKPVVQRVFKMAAVPDAYNMLEMGNARGKVVIEMDEH